MNMSEPAGAERSLTMSVPQAGALLGLNRGASYAAAARGDLPVYKFGPRLMRVPTAAFFQRFPGLKPTSEK